MKNYLQLLHVFSIIPPSVKVFFFTSTKITSNETALYEAAFILAESFYRI